VIGLPPFLETGPPTLRGRDADRDGVLRMLAKQWVRAGLLVGEVGVGKTAFLRHGIVSHLRATGVALVCEEPLSPARSFSEAAAAAGYSARPGESHLDLLARAVETAPGNSSWTFIYDDLDLALGAGGHVAQELAELLTRVCPKPGGRARLLFSAADVRMQACDALERLVGPLFAVTSRYALPRLGPQHAAEALADALASEGAQCEPGVAGALCESLAEGGGVLPVDIRVLARATLKLGILTERDLVRRGGPGDLVRRWIVGAADASGNRPAALRVLGELASTRTEPLGVEELARRAGVGPGLAGLVLQCAMDWGLCARVAGKEHAWALAHEALVERVRPVTAPEMERAGRARRTLEAAAVRHGRVSWRGWLQVKRSHVAPASAEQAAALRATSGLGIRLVFYAAALPLLYVAIVYAALWGRFHVTVENRSGGERLLVRAGRPGPHWLFWLPHRPRFGSVVADPGIARWMVGRGDWAAAAWMGGSLSRMRGSRPEYLAASLHLLRAPVRGVLDYVLDREGAGAMAALERTLELPEDWTEALDLLAPVARGGDAEARLLITGLRDKRHEVRAAALSTVARVERRRPGLYRDVLAVAIASPDPVLARRTRAVVQGLPEAERVAVAAMGAVKAHDATLRDRLLSDIGSPDALGPGVAAAVAAALLGARDGEASAAAVARGWDLLDYAFSNDAAAATTAAASLVADATGEAVRVRALHLLADRAPPAALSRAGIAVAAAVASKSSALRLAALPLYARIQPAAARPLLSENGKPELRAAQALAWGEICAADAAAARAAIEALLLDANARVRADAARAYGRLGRAAQDKLLALAKDPGVVGEGAAWGLAASVEAGGSLDEALLGIGRLWGKKGIPKRAAARVYAHMAQTQPAVVLGYLVAAARDVTDGELRRTGVEGLCAAHEAHSDRAVAAALLAVAASPDAGARAQVAACLAAHPAPAETILRVAERLRSDADAGTRRRVARALAAVAARGATGRGAREVAAGLAELVADHDHAVRAEALAGLSGAVSGPDRTVMRALRAAWALAADEDEKLSVVAAAQRAGEAGVLEQAVADGSPVVRVRALEGMGAAGGDLRAAVERALADGDARVRRAALRALADAGDKVARADAVDLLETALGDSDVQAEALLLYARLEYPTRALARLEAALAAPSERDRAMAARAASALVLRGVPGARALLQASLADPARDVRAAALEALAEVEAQKRTPPDLTRALAGAEQDAERRLLFARALLLAARSDRAGVQAALDPVARSGPPLARFTAEILLALLRTDADGPAFLAALVP
jgi:HEAT repeat protein